MYNKETLKTLKDWSDLANPKISIVNREKGSGARGTT